MTDDKELYRLLSLITKLTSYVIKNAEHQEIKEDVINEVFLKVYKSDFIKSHNLQNEEEALIVAAYLKRAIQTTYHDTLTKLGIMRRSTKNERQVTGKKTQAIESVSYGNDDEEGFIELGQADSYTQEQYMSAKRAYHAIKNCFDKGVEKIKDAVKVTFFEAAFWDYGSFDLPINQLAKVLGYNNSNPTQDFNRFIEKINLCTAAHDIKIVEANEQIDILRQIIESGEALA